MNKHRGGLFDDFLKEEGIYDECTNVAKARVAEMEMLDDPWIIGSVHPEYGEVQMMGTLQGEKYRWMIKDGTVSMIPLSVMNHREGCGA